MCTSGSRYTILSYKLIAPVAKGRKGDRKYRFVNVNYTQILREERPNRGTPCRPTKKLHQLLRAKRKK